MTTALLHRPGRRNAFEAREAGRALAAALGAEVEVRAGGEPAEGEWVLRTGGDLLRADAPRLVHLPRRDPRWSLEDLAKRPLEALPAGVRVVVGSHLGEALLLRARPDLVAVRAGSFPLPEETPVLAEGPFDGRPAGDPLDLARFVPAPGTGLRALVAPATGEIPPAVLAMGDAEAGTLHAIERSFLAGMGDLPEGAALGVLARRKVSVLFGVRAVLFRPGAAPREVVADIPLENAAAFARGFGRHLAGGRT